MRCVLALFVSLRLVCCDENPALRGTGKLEQVLVFDAGSSGTRVHVFNMYPAQRGAHVPTIELSVRDKQTLKVKPGLSDFALRDDLDGTRKNIESLLEFASQHVPFDSRKSTPVLLKATAGLRSVPAIQADAVLNQVRATLKVSGYLFKEDWVDIIRGKEEGGLAWVAANYLRGTFGVNDQPSIGVIELGGGSTQVTFQVASTEKVADSDAFTFKTLVGKEFHLYAHSYLGFGQDHALATMKARTQALFLSGPVGDMKDPCYPEGFLSPVRSSAAADTETTVKYLHSSGDAVACQELIRTELFKPATGAPGNYASELPLRGQFAATENFFYVRNDAKMPLLSSQTSMQEAAKFVCSLAEKNEDREIERMKAGNVSRPKACFALSYQAALLEVLKVHTSVGVKLEIARQINGGDVDWALGAALMHSIANTRGTSDGQVGNLVLLVGALLVGVSVVAWFMRGGRSQFLKSLAGSRVIQATTLGASKISPAE